MSETSDDQTVYKVLINDEEQYSLWPSDSPVPAGWREAGKSGTRQGCVAYVDSVWTDMRPLSLRKTMSEAT